MIYFMLRGASSLQLVIDKRSGRAAQGASPNLTLINLRNRTNAVPNPQSGIEN